MNRCLRTLAILAILLPVTRLAAQDEEPQLEEFLRPARNDASIDLAFRSMYDLDFPEADRKLDGFVAENPTDPLGPAAQAASVLFAIFEENRVLQSEFFASDDGYGNRKVVVVDDVIRSRFDADLSRAERLARQTLDQDSTNQNALFALTLSYGLRADYAALIEHRDLAALRFSETGSSWAKKLLAISPGFHDAYVATGVQTYLVSLKPAPVRWVLRMGGIRSDQTAGIRELQLAAQDGRYLGPFARILLAVAHLRNQQVEDAFRLLDGLQQEFPHNPLFAQEIVKLQPHTETDAKARNATAPSRANVR
jgi:hypothetical protein